MHRFSQRSIDNLKGVHPDLITVARVALARSPVDFGITEGVRTAERQQELFRAGSSRMEFGGRHVSGHAIDVFAWVDNGVTWEWEYYEQLAEVFKSVAAELGIPLNWGGDWRTLKDGVHFELDRGTYL